MIFLWNSFTFQSGYIPIRCRTCNTYFLCFFTFQSGYIPIRCGRRHTLGQFSLHSNLVIFQLLPCRLRVPRHLLYIPIWSYSNTHPIMCVGMLRIFTFQSGHIPMGNTSLGSQVIPNFTFQSGHIPI